MKIKLLIADDHALVRGGLKSMLNDDAEIEEIIEAVNGHEAITKAREFKPDVVVMDYEMPNFNGVYATREILKELPDTRIILVSAHHSREYIMEGIHAGIRGFLPKEARSSELLQAIKALARGETWFRGSTAELLAPGFVDSIHPTKGHTHQEPVLTPREKEIVRFLAKGMNSHEIAKKLSISKRTVDVHKFNVFKKLDIANSIELMRYAIRHKLVKV